MKTTITHDFETLEEAGTFLEALAYGKSVLSNAPAIVEGVPHPASVVGQLVDAARAAKATVVNAASLAPDEPKKRGRKKAEPVAVVVPVPPAPSMLTEADVQKALEQVFEAKGINTARDLLSRYCAKRAREVKPEFYAKFVAHAKEVMAGEPA